MNRETMLDLAITSTYVVSIVFALQFLFNIIFGG